MKIFYVLAILGISTIVVSAQAPVTVTNLATDAGDNAPPTSNPVPFACVQAPSSVLTTGNQGYVWCTPSHSLVVTPWPGVLASGAVTSAMTGTTSTQVIAGVSSNYIYVTQCTVSNASTTASTDILLQNGSAGTTLYVLPAPAAAVGTSGGGGGVFEFPVPLKVPTTGNGLYAANVNASSTKISCSGFTSTVSY